MWNRGIEPTTITNTRNLHLPLYRSCQLHDYNVIEAESNLVYTDVINFFKIFLDL